MKYGKLQGCRDVKATTQIRFKSKQSARFGAAVSGSFIPSATNG
jgi:hypothetical protein